jgi:hypothetical protein
MPAISVPSRYLQVRVTQKNRVPPLSFPSIRQPIEDMGGPEEYVADETRGAGLKQESLKVSVSLAAGHQSAPSGSPLMQLRSNHARQLS